MSTLTVQERIDQIDDILASGVSSVGSGDDRIQYDLEALRKERSSLIGQLSSTPGSQFTRVTMSNNG